MGLSLLRTASPEIVHSAEGRHFLGGVRGRDQPPKQWAVELLGCVLSRESAVVLGGRRGAATVKAGDVSNSGAQVFADSFWRMGTSGGGWVMGIICRSEREKS